MVTNSFQNKVSLSPWLLCVLVRFHNEFLTFAEFPANEKPQHALIRSPVFFRLGRKGGRENFLYFPLFPMCSHRCHQVLKLFLNTIKIAAQFYPILFAQNSTLMYINWEGGPERAHLSTKQGSLFCFVWLRSPKPLFLPSPYLTCSLRLEETLRRGGRQQPHQALKKSKKYKGGKKHHMMVAQSSPKMPK